MASRREYEMLFSLNAQLGGSYNSTFNSAQKSIAKMQQEIELLTKTQSNISAYEKQKVAIESTQNKLKVLQQQYDNIQKEMNETGTYSSTLENKLLAKQQQIDKTSASIAEQTVKLGRMSKALEEAGIDTNSLRAEEAKLGVQLDELKAKQVAAAEKANSFGNQASAAFGAVHQAIVAAGITIALKEMYEWFASTAKASMEFESAMTGVSKTTDMSGNELAALAEDIKELSTEMPITTSELAGITEAAGQLGIKKDNLLEFTEVMANLGVATNLTSSDAATALAKFANVVRMSADDYERLGSVIVDLGNNSATTESDIVSMATRLASTGALIGLSEPEIMAVASAMSSLGIEAEAGGSAISKLLKQFEVMVQTGAPELADFAKVAGMSAEEFSVAWGENSVEAMAKFVDGLGRIDAAGGSSVATLEELGITEVRMSNAVLSLASSGGILTDSLKTANAAWKDNTALTNEAKKRYATTESQLKMMQNEYNNLKIAIGDNFNPVLKEMYALGTDVLKGMTQFIQQNPALVKAVTVFVGILAAVVAALAAYAVAAKVAAVASALLTAAIPGLNIIMGIAMGVAALTAGIVALTSALNEGNAEFNSLTATSKENYTELQEATKAYEEAKETYDETSDEALRLRYEVDELTDAYEANKQTLDEFVAESDALLEVHGKIISSYKKSTASINDEEQGLLALVLKLEKLSKKTSLSTVEQKQMKAAVDALNEALPNLSLNYNDATKSLNMTTDSLKAMVKAQAEQERQAENYKAWVKLTKEELKLKDQLAEAEKNLNAERQRRGMYYDELYQQWTNGSYTEDSLWASWTTDLDDYNKEVDRLTTAYEENQAALADVTAKAEEYNAAQQDGTTSGKELSGTITDTTEQMTALADKYKEVYDAALESIQGQYELWDKAAEVVATSAGTINQNIEGQLSYWQKYNENLANLIDRTDDIAGLQEMLASFADGSEESVNAIAGMAKASDSDLKKMVENWQTLRNEQKTVADKLADLQTDFKAGMDALQKELETSIGKMNLDDEAAQSGKNTIQGFIDGATAMTPEVQAAYKKVADAAVAAIDERLEIHSPSQVMWEKGEFAMSGFTGGVESMTPDVREAMSGAAGSGVDAFSSAMQAESSGGGGTVIQLEYSPQYEVSGSNAEEIEAMLRSHDNNLRDTILDLLESVGIDAKRRAYV